MGTPLQITNFFSLPAFKIIFLSLNFGILIMMSGPLAWDALCFSDLLIYFLHQIREVFFHYFFQIDFQLLALSLLFLPHLSPLRANVRIFEVVP